MYDFVDLLLMYYSFHKKGLLKMAKNKILDLAGVPVDNGIVDVDGQEIKKQLPKIIGVQPFGSMVLIEHLNADEALGTNLVISEETDVGSPQAYVVGFGPKVPEDCGLKIGDRVMLQGTYVPILNFDNHPRRRGLVEIHNIKAILVEESTN